MELIFDYFIIVYCFTSCCVVKALPHVPFSTLTLCNVYFYDKYFFILIIIHAIVHIIQFFNVMFSVQRNLVPTTKETVHKNNFFSPSKQLIVLYYIVTYKSVDTISTNYMVMFRPFGQHKIQNQNFELHSEWDFSLISTQCISLKLLYLNFRKHLNIKAFLM